jgi:hypothetical protein
MNAQETIESEKQRVEAQTRKQKKLPCIYDPEIRNPCLVRQAIANKTAPVMQSLAKYTLPKDVAGFGAGIGEIFSAMGEALHSELSVLSAYCEHCPSLKTFTEKEYYEFHDERMEKMKQRRRERRKPKT